MELLEFAVPARERASKRKGAVREEFERRAVRRAAARALSTAGVGSVASIATVASHSVARERKRKVPHDALALEAGGGVDVHLLEQAAEHVVVVDEKHGLLLLRGVLRRELVQQLLGHGQHVIDRADDPLRVRSPLL